MIKPVLHYFNLADEVVCFSTTRHGGVSKGKLSTLNINPHRGDEPSAVAENLQAVAAEIGVKADKIVRLHQIHETHCLTVTDDFFYLSVAEQYEREEGKDAVVTACRLHWCSYDRLFSYSLLRPRSLCYWGSPCRLAWHGATYRSTYTS